MAVTLMVDNLFYRVWTSVRLTRGLKRAVSDFQFEAPAEYIPVIAPFMPCMLMDGDDLLLTGYVDCCKTEVEAKSSKTVISGRSKVMDLIDCMPGFATNQFDGYTIDAIARTVAGAFGLQVVIGPGVVVGDPFPDATFERAEKAYAFIERLAAQRGILLTDDENGNLVLATLGIDRAPAALVMGQGGNVFRASGELDGKKRYSEYSIRSQAGIKQTGSTVQTAVRAVAYDYGVPRYRPWAGIARSASLTNDAQIRANWEAAHRAGEAIKGVLSVPEWRANGTLWQCNRVVACNVPRLGLNDDLLIGEFTMLDDAKEGRRTELTVQPPAAFVPDPVEKKARGKGGGSGVGGPWDFVPNVVPPSEADGGGRALV